VASPLLKSFLPPLFKGGELWRLAAKHSPFDGAQGFVYNGDLGDEAGIEEEAEMSARH
jgi:hypothetical protein